MKLNLKKPTSQEPYIGKHIDLLLEAAAKNDYAVSVYYDEPLPALGRRDLLCVKVDSSNIVIQIK